MRSNLRIGILIFLASVAFQSTFITLDAFVSDEGIVLVAADDVAHGRLLYEDTSIPLTPVAYLVQGLVFKLFGSSFFVSRMLVCFVNALCAAMVFNLAGRFLPLRRAAFAGALAVPLQVWMWPHAQYFSYNQLTVLLCLVAMRVAWSIETGPSRRNAFAFGCVLAAALWTKPSLPVAVGAGVLLYWMTCWLRSAYGLPCSRQRGFREILEEGVATLCGIAAASLPICLYLASLGILDDVITSVVKITQIYGDSPTGLFPSLFPLTGQIDAVRMSTGLVLPGMLINVFEGIGKDPFYHHLVLFSGWVDLGVRVIYYTPIVLYAATGWVLLGKMKKGGWSAEDEAALAVLCASLLLYFTNVSFAALHYITPTLLPLAALATFAVTGLTSDTQPRRIRAAIRISSRMAVAIYLAGSLAALAAYLAVPRAPVHSPRGTVWVANSTAVVWNEILTHIDAAMDEGDDLFVYPYFPLFHFLSGRDHPSRFIALGPGFPGVETEDEIIATLERQRVEFTLNAYAVQYPGLEKFENAYPRLNHYLDTHYDVERSFQETIFPYADFLKRRPPNSAEPVRDHAVPSPTGS